MAALVGLFFVFVTNLSRQNDRSLYDKKISETVIQAHFLIVGSLYSMIKRSLIKSVEKDTVESPSGRLKRYTSSSKNLYKTFNCQHANRPETQ